MKSQVAIVKSTDNIKENIYKLLDLLGGIENFAQSGERYLLKPNLFTTKTPEDGATTDMRIVLSYATALKDIGATPIIGECPASESYARPDIVFDELGVRRLCRENDLELRVLDRDKPVRVDVEGEVLEALWFPESALTLDGIVNFPKLKTHVLTTLTCAVKNLFGLQQGGSKANHHVRVSNDPKRFSHLLLDLYNAINDRIKLNIVDGIIGMEGEGPTTGNPVNSGLIIAGEDAVAVDMVVSKIIGWDPMEVGTNRLAVERGLGPKGLREVEILGLGLNEVRHNFRRPTIHQAGQSFVEARMPLVCNQEKCVGCGICETVCPVRAIEVNDYPRFDEEICIQCFCCLELCPEGAITVIRGE